MNRALPLVVFAALVIGLFLIPAPDPARLGAIHAGALLEEVAEVPEGTDWRDTLTRGEVVLVGEAKWTVKSLDGDQVTLSQEGVEPVAKSRAELTALAEKRPLWRYLVQASAADSTESGYTLRIRGGRMIGAHKDVKLHDDMIQSVVRGLRAKGADQGFEVELERKQNAEFPGLQLKCERLTEDTLELEVTLPDGLVATAQKTWHPADGRSLVPPLIAILLAILLRQPVLALLAGVLAGSMLVPQVAGSGIFTSISTGLRDAGLVHLWAELADRDRQLIVGFVVFMLAMVGVITKAGGIHGLMSKISKLAKDARKTQIATWFMGLVVFFDDYANTILVGSTMRPLTDRFKVAREKLAYIVDSTAAPVAGISILSTWIAFEVSTFSAQLPDAALSPSDGYAVFMETLPYRFYCLFTLFFVGLVVFTGRDFGPMLKAERRARAGEVLREGATPLVGKGATELAPKEGVRSMASVAVLPILTFVGVTLGYIIIKGGAFAMSFAELTSIEGMTAVLYDGSGFEPLFYGALAGFVVAAVMGLIVGLRSEIATSAWGSLRSMGVAIVILYLAWTIGRLCGELNTAEYLTVLLGDHLNPLILPVILFLLAGFIAFSTGSSWSTMTILLPLVVGLAYTMGESLDGFGGHAMVVVSIGAVLEGAIWGDHCSPISDTTVMSSIASASDHVDHVRTQMPYAVTTMSVAMLCGYLPAVILGLSPWISLLLGMAALTAFLYWKGEKAGEAPA